MAMARLLVTGALAWVAACTPTQVRYETVVPPGEPAGGLEAVVYLVGDAGESSPARSDVLGHLTVDIEAVAGDGAVPALVAFLGDNIYDEGLPTEPSPEDLDKLTGQVLALGEDRNVRGVFLPGNHDWANGASVEDGREAVARQSEWIDAVRPGRDIRFLPDDGCPGPATVDLGETIHLVFIDTEWVLRKPEQRCGTALEFYARLTADLRANSGKRTVILAHHPLVSGGPHGGNVAPLEQGPFVYYLARKTGASVQDISSRRYSTVIRRIQEAIAASGTRPLVYAGGHDHTLQVIGMSGAGTPVYQLVSGAGSKSERSAWVRGMRYATDGYGYMRLDFRADRVDLTVFARGVDSRRVQPVFGCRLTADDSGCPEAPRTDAP